MIDLDPIAVTTIRRSTDHNAITRRQALGVRGVGHEVDALVHDKRRPRRCRPRSRTLEMEQPRPVMEESAKRLSS